MLRNVNQHSFARVPRADIPRSVFDRSFTHKTTFDSGYLIPVFCDEALPGDTFSLQASFFTRLATPVVPIMDNLWLDSFFFFVPNRLVWSHWQAMNGEQTDPDSSTDYICPTVSADSTTGFTVGSIYDYLGIPTGVASLEVNALPLRACNLIWNEWFRDENLQDSLPVATGDGPDSASDYALFRRGKRHDYFTSALPWPQKGPGVELPLGEYAPVASLFPRLSDSVYPTVANGIGDTSNNYGFFVPQGASWAQLEGGRAEDANPLVADLSRATSATINSLRQAFQLQKLYERDARSGTRFTEILRSHFGVISPDARLQRPEYLGGSSSRITINPVIQTSGTGASGQATPQGNLAAYGVSSDVFHGFTKSFVEHGYVIGFVSVRADLTYQQGLNRMWSRRTRFDWYWPVLAHLGEQTILNKEIYAQGPDVTDSSGTAVDDLPFGYQERYAEYRYYPSMITGQFRSTYSAPLDVWHLSQYFESLPTLSDTFIEDNPPVSRVVATKDYPQFLFDAYFKYKCARPMPVFSVPGLVDHF